MKTMFFQAAALLLIITGCSTKVSGPDKQTKLQFDVKEGIPTYSLSYKGKTLIEDSPLGLETSAGSFSKEMKLVDRGKPLLFSKSYKLDRGKASQIIYTANEVTYTLENKDGKEMRIIFRISNNDVAFCYQIYADSITKSCIVNSEATAYDFPEGTTTFITPQAPPMSGWKETKPSYEEHYTENEPVGKPSQYGIGFTYPALFKVGEAGWVLISETDVDSRYVGTCLSEGTKEGLYKVQFPQQGENNGQTPNTVTAVLPLQTPWRTITLGDNLKPIVETTIATDLVSPRYKASEKYMPGRATWSWLVWQDNSINYEDQIKFIDLADSLNFEYVLIDNWWDANIGREKVAELARYAAAHNVRPILWYNSNGSWNNAPQTPQDCMDTPEARAKEMTWMQSIGIKGIKVDFFGGDKQSTMKLYEDILKDANNYGICVNFHGATLPRGWERMYPNYMTSEAVYGMENCIFTQEASNKEPMHCAMLPFTRNAVGPMDFTPTVLNNRMSKDQQNGSRRRTSAAFELALPIVFFSPIQHFGLTPDNLLVPKDSTGSTAKVSVTTSSPDVKLEIGVLPKDPNQPYFVTEYLKRVPTTWDETKFIEGFPGKYCVIARRSGEKWYIGAINGDVVERKIDLDLSFMGKGNVIILLDANREKGSLMWMELVKKEKGKITLTLKPESGAVLYTK